MWVHLMHKALDQARAATKAGDAPFGCVVLDPRMNIVWQDRDRVTSTCDPTAHAEVNAIRAICRSIGKTKLDGFTFVTTSEPCPTCLSVLIRARVKLCVFGARIEADASLPVPSEEIALRALKHRIELIGGVLEEQCEQERSNCFSPQEQKIVA